MFGVDPASDGGERLTNDLESVSDSIVERGLGKLCVLKQVVSKGVNGGSQQQVGLGLENRGRGSRSLR